MNKDQIKGTAKIAAGKVQKTVGRVTGSTTQEAKGLAKEAAGQTRRAYGNAKEAVSDKGSVPRDRSRGH